MEITVEPELYSMMVFVFPGTTLEERRFMAAKMSISGVSLQKVGKIVPGMALTLFAGCIVIIFA